MRRLFRHEVIICLTVVFLLSTASSVRAQPVENKDPENRTDVRYVGVYPSPSDGLDHAYQFIVWLDPGSPKEVNMVLDDMAFHDFGMLADNFSRVDSRKHLEFHFSNAVRNSEAHYEIIRYDAGLSNGPGPSSGGVWDDKIRYDFQVDYIDNRENPTLPGWKRAWIQFVHTDFPLPGEGTIGSASVSIDPYKYGMGMDFEDGLPLYYSEREMNPPGLVHNQKIYDREPGIAATFYDAPNRPFSWLINNDIHSMYWEAYLYECDWSDSVPGNAYINVIGIKWGFRIAWLDLGTAMAAPREIWANGGVAGNKYDYIPGDPLNSTATVGGYSYPIGVKPPMGRFELLGAEIFLGSTATAGTVVLLHKFRHRRIRKKG